MEEIGLATEWCGISDKGLVEPKSFSGLGEELKAEAYRALAYLLGNPYASKGIKRCKNAQLNNAQGFFFDLLLADSIIQVAEGLKSAFKPEYAKRVESRSAVRGKINFAKTLKAGHGLLNKHVCEFPQLSFSNEVFALLKVAVPALKARFGNSVSPELKLKLMEATNLILDYTRETEINSEPSATALKLILERLPLSQALRPLGDPIRVISHFYLGQVVHLSRFKDQKKSQGLLLNLNRTFEYLLIIGMKATGNFNQDMDPINEIYYQDKTGSKTDIDPMRPDCKGTLSFNGNSYYLLLDAKHKIFSRVASKEDADETGSISRADMYQVLSYGLTSKHRKHKKQIVVLVGLAKETELESGYLNRLPDVVVEFNNEQFLIQRFAMNFARILIDISRALAATNSPDNIYKKIGMDLISAMELNSNGVKTG